MLPMFAPPPPAPIQHLMVGQLRACRSRHADRKLVVVIGKLEDLTGSPIAHVTIRDATPGARLPEVGHSPFFARVLEASCPEIVGRGAVSAEFENGYAQWREAQGGVFTITVEQALDLSASMLPQPASGSKNVT